jgi:hypothetical protein
MGRAKGRLDSVIESLYGLRKRRSASTEQLSAKAGKKKKDGLTALSASDTGAQAFRAHFKAAGGPVAGGRTCG